MGMKATTMKAKRIIKTGKMNQATVALGKFAKTVAISKRPAGVDVSADELQKSAKKSRVTPQDEKSLAAERKLTLTALKLPDLDDLHKKNALGTEAVKDVVARAREELSSKQLPELKETCGKKELKVGGSKGELVQRLLDHAKEELKTSMVQALLIFEANARKEAREQEARAREEARQHAARVREVVSKMKKDVGPKTGDELKQLLTGYGLKLGGSKTEKIDRIVARQKEDGEVDKILAGMARDARKQELLSMDSTALMDMCTKTKGVLEDRLVKEIMVDRLLLSDSKVQVS